MPPPPPLPVRGSGAALAATPLADGPPGLHLAGPVPPSPLTQQSNAVRSVHSLGGTWERAKHQPIDHLRSSAL